jgi:hypothetical protein
MDDDLHWRIAVHESSHCIIARLTGLPCGGASARNKFQAYAEFDRDCGEASICALMAGAAGEVVILGDHHPTGLKEDWERAQLRLARLGWDDGGAELWRWTVSVLAAHSDAVVRLASALMDARSLSGDEIDALM